MWNWNWRIQEYVKEVICDSKIWINRKADWTKSGWNSANWDKTFSASFWNNYRNRNEPARVPQLWVDLTGWARYLGLGSQWHAKKEDRSRQSRATALSDQLRCGRDKHFASNIHQTHRIHSNFITPQERATSFYSSSQWSSERTKGQPDLSRGQWGAQVLGQDCDEQTRGETTY